MFINIICLVLPTIVEKKILTLCRAAVVADAMIVEEGETTPSVRLVVVGEINPHRRQEIEIVGAINAVQIPFAKRPGENLNRIYLFLPVEISVKIA